MHQVHFLCTFGILAMPSKMMVLIGFRPARAPNSVICLIHSKWSLRLLWSIHCSTSSIWYNNTFVTICCLLHITSHFININIRVHRNITMITKILHNFLINSIYLNCLSNSIVYVEPLMQFVCLKFDPIKLNIPLVHNFASFHSQLDHFYSALDPQTWYNWI